MVMFLKKILKQLDQGFQMFEYEYPRASITADVFVYNSLDKSFLAIVRKNAPFKGCFALPGGFMNMNESLGECAIRELKEETNLDKDDICEPNFIAMLDMVNRDPRGRTISALFCTEIYPDSINKVKAADDAAEFIWIPVAYVLKLNFAFDHKNAIFLSLRSLGLC